MAGLKELSSQLQAIRKQIYSTGSDKRCPSGAYDYQKHDKPKENKLLNWMYYYLPICER